jgi:putative FmdB family regulatory protein
MPTYDYQCEACGHRFEKFQSIKAPPIRRCPSCGKNQVKRLLSTGAGIIFRGSGFYITDYRDPSYHEKAKADTGGASTSSSDKSADAPKPAATDAKPAAPAPKAEAKPAGAPKRKHSK